MLNNNTYNGVKRVYSIRSAGKIVQIRAKNKTRMWDLAQSPVSSEFSR